MTRTLASNEGVRPTWRTGKSRFRSWSGSMFSASDDRRSVKPLWSDARFVRVAIVNVLPTPSVRTRQAQLDIMIGVVTDRA